MQRGWKIFHAIFRGESHQSLHHGAGAIPHKSTRLSITRDQLHSPSNQLSDLVRVMSTTELPMPPPEWSAIVLPLVKAVLGMSLPVMAAWWSPWRTYCDISMSIGPGLLCAAAMFALSGITTLQVSRFSSVSCLFFRILSYRYCCMPDIHLLQISFRRSCSSETHGNVLTSRMYLAHNMI